MISELRRKSYERDVETFCGFLETNPRANMLDIGCGDGRKTLRFSESVGTNKITGLDIKPFGVPFGLIEADIERGIPVVSNLFDVVTSYHNIEHLSNTDLFVKEVYRILVPGGYVLVATPNLASGRVIIELLLNKQPNTAHTSDFFIPRGDPEECWRKSVGYLHKRLFTGEGLSKLLTCYGFKIEHVRGTGYGPFPFLNVVLRGLYAADLIVKARKC